ncbi:SAF domain-containing protein [Alicyclobacillus tolerans]|uniref:SAF domain-containing protein n=1 Tax=Alicyclobacillus tolerans TaxID=90970 RepID=UPI001F2E18D1|nr:SAF domain-containing protein [Alicyclobacillus tolerans]MCF8567440.1 SAF domain-containing protein [Alicyclobacillus tolerans]
MKTAKYLRIAAGLMVVSAAVVGGYTVYQAERTEPVWVATREIPPFTFVTPSEVTLRSIPVSAVQSDALHVVASIVGHRTTVGILPNAQIRKGMFSSDTTLQGLVNSVTQSGNVTFPLPYKPGDMESYISPDSYVDLITPGPNGTMIHADHVLVLKNTGYQTPLAPKNQNSNPMLIMTLPESTYLPMAQNIGNHNVQILMIPQSGTTDTTAGSYTVTQTSVTGTPVQNTGNPVHGALSNSVTQSASSNPRGKGTKK